MKTVDDIIEQMEVEEEKKDNDALEYTIVFIEKEIENAISKKIRYIALGNVSEEFFYGSSINRILSDRSLLDKLIETLRKSGFTVRESEHEQVSGLLWWKKRTKIKLLIISW